MRIIPLPSDCWLVVLWNVIRIAETDSLDRQNLPFVAS